MLPGSPRSPLLLTALSLLLLSATGCFDVQQDLWIEPGGSARLVVDVSIPQARMDLREIRGSLSPRQLLFVAAGDIEKALREAPEVAQVMLRDYEKEGRDHLVYDVTVKDVTRLPDLYRRTAEQNKHVPWQPRGVWDFGIERQGGQYVFTQRFNIDKLLDRPRAPGNEAVDPAAAQAFAKGFLRATLGNNRLTLRIHGPSIGETNGTVNEKKDTVEWKLNLAELMDAPAEGREFRAVIHDSAPLWLWPVVLGVPVAVLLLTLSAARNRRRAAAR
ncbi:hypothetical protein A176_000557 [Myxococcus hansupus]|uniref:Lipoprotein n=1 Tax=Pseudomyxococcus hansupus TaxID=1297742 RepID=A0A0H4WQN8_9BACT|nr:hypothetical protein [Myxococcus hansupus]AKQ63645.1 hypothetical protein A176_000557 [Myxococcus hansupus]